MMERWTTPCGTTSTPSPPSTGLCSIDFTGWSSKRIQTLRWCSHTGFPRTGSLSAACSSARGSMACRSMDGTRARTPGSPLGTLISRQARARSTCAPPTPPASMMPSSATSSAPRSTADHAGAVRVERRRPPGHLLSWGQGLRASLRGRLRLGSRPVKPAGGAGQQSRRSVERYIQTADWDQPEQRLRPESDHGQDREEHGHHPGVLDIPPGQERDDAEKPNREMGDVVECVDLKDDQRARVKARCNGKADQPDQRVDDTEHDGVDAREIHRKRPPSVAGRRAAANSVPSVATSTSLV